MLGWLHGVPESQKGKDGQGLTRGQVENWPMPEVNAYYLVDIFYELGSEFDFNEIKAFTEVTGTEINSMEATLLINLSRIYMSSRIKFNCKQYDLTPPHNTMSDEQRAKMISDKFKKSMARFKS